MKKILSLAMLALCLTACNTEKPNLNPVIDITGGKVRGVESETPGVVVYKGIPYAAPPVGDLRWKAPQPVVPWDTVMVADHFSAIAFQSPHVSGPDSTVISEYGQVDYVKEFFAEGDPEMSEDCLYLNVWRPAEAKMGDKLPVAFWIHGGAFMSGYGFEKEFDGAAFAKKGVILVTINYRLGIFGFLAHPLLSAENADRISGNYGMLDQIKALDWTRENIANFGGDPDNITVFGQSAGAMSVRNLLCSPMTKGKIAKAIIQSGGAISPDGNEMRMTSSLADYEQLGQAIMGDKALEDMRKMSYQDLQAEVMRYMTENKTYLMLQPNVDGKVLEGDLAACLDKDFVPHIPIMMGSTLDDMTFTRMGEPYVYLSSRLAQHGKAPYVYEFCRRLPGNGSGAFHSAELWYVFGTIDRCWRPLGEADKALSERIVSYWTNFMKSGNPNGEGLPEWKACTTGLQDVMRFDIEH
jgi:para-nitrobenzyl esterase